mgnify:CR=1 FL=1
MNDDTLKKIQLRIQRDGLALHDIYMEASFEPDFPLDYKNMHYDEFCNWLSYEVKRKCHDYYVIQHNNEIIGFFMTYRFRMVDGTTFLYYFIKEKLNSSDKEQLISGLVEKLFEQYPLRKIFMTSIEGRLDKEELLKRVGFHTIFSLKEHRYYRKQYLEEKIWEICS